MSLVDQPEPVPTIELPKTPMGYPVGLYERIVENQTERDRPHRDDLIELRRWSALLIERLPLQTKDSVFLSVPLIQIRKLRNIKTISQYDPQFDGYAIAGTISFHEERLAALRPYQRIALLLRHLLEAREHHRALAEQRSSNGRFTLNERTLREEANALGLAVTRKHKVKVTRGGRLHALLRHEGVESEAEECLPEPDRPGRSTLIVWTCGCQTIRVDRGNVLARCTKRDCGQEFRRLDYRD